MKMKLQENKQGAKPTVKNEHKKSTGFSEKTQTKKRPIAGSNESETLDKKPKRGKFEKPLATKKFDKSTKPNFVQKNDKSFVKKEQVDDRKKFPTPSADGEKPNWVELKKEKRELKEKRKAKRLAAVYEPSVKAKSIGEKLRRADCTVEERAKLTKKLYQLLEGSFNKAIFTHDMSRVIQWLLKYCSPEIREAVLTELKPSLVPMFQSKYAKNCIKKMLKHGTDTMRTVIVTSCYGHVVKLVSHSVSSPLVDYAYKTFATDQQKIHFKQEFYGDMYKQAKDDNIKAISDVYASASDMKSATLSAVKINLSRALNKNLVASPLIQAVLVDYLAVCTAEDRAEMIVMLRNSIVELSGSANGARLAMICIWHGTNKDRKLSLKAIKQHVANIAKSEHGHVILMAMFDCIDDTVLMKKLVISEILSELVEIASNEYGRRVILHLVARRDQAHFHPALVEQLKQGDGNPTSKKTADIRETELIEAIIEPLLVSIAENIEIWLANSSIAMVTLAILKRGAGGKLEGALEAIARFITNKESTIKEEDGVERSVVEHSGLHMMLKKLILTDKNFAEKSSKTFGEIMAEQLDVETIERWINFNRGCFLLILLIENSLAPVVDSLNKKLKFVSQSLKTKKGPGASILLKKIK